MKHEEFAGRLHEATWLTNDPLVAQSQLLADLARDEERTSLPGSLQLGQMALRLRDPQSLAESRELLIRWERNPWAASLIAEIDMVSGHSAEAVRRLGSLPGSHGDLPTVLAIQVLRLAARLDLDLFDELGGAFRNVDALDEVMFPLRPGPLTDTQALERYASLLASRSNISFDRALSAVSITARITQQSNPHAAWSDVEAISHQWVNGVLDRIADAQANGHGFSLIRLFDGEAEFLTGRREDLAGAAGRLPDGAHRKLTDSEHELTQSAMRSAIEHATVCVVPDLVQMIYGPDRTFGVAAWLSSVHEPRANLIAGPVLFGWSVEAYGHTPRLASLATGVIGPADPEHCRPLAGRKLTWLRIPGEAHFFAKEPSQESHFHDYFDRIRNYPFAPGQVWLVAAGILGKAYCESIRAAGGVAVDVGAVMDLWAGRGDTRQTVRLYPWIARSYLQ